MSKVYGSVYTPQINEDSAFLLRRVAWAAEKPMTYTLDECLKVLLKHIDRKVLCGACQDHRCLEKEGEVIFWLVSVGEGESHSRLL